MMVAVPALAHRRDRHERHVIGLDHRAIDGPVLRPARMGEVGDEPMHRCTGGDADEHAPDDPWPAAEQEEGDCDRYLLQHPIAIEEEVERIVGDAWTRIETRWSRELQPEMQIIKTVNQHRLSVTQEPVAVRL